MPILNDEMVRSVRNFECECIPLVVENYFMRKTRNNGIFIKEVGRLLSQFSPLNVSNLSTLSQQHPEITES